jgi:glutamyl-tRNA synthetase
MEQFTEWFNLESISRSPAKFNPEKLNWVNQQYIKAADNDRLADLVRPFMEKQIGPLATSPALADVIALLKDRVSTLVELADAAHLFYKYITPDAELLAQHLSPEATTALQQLTEQLAEIDWNKEAIHDAIKATVTASGLKMPKIAMPLRIIVAGVTQTPSIDATLLLIGRETVLARLRGMLGA